MEAFFREVTRANAMPPQDPALWRAYSMESALVAFASRVKAGAPMLMLHEGNRWSLVPFSQAWAEGPTYCGDSMTGSSQVTFSRWKGLEHRNNTHTGQSD